MRHPAIYHSLEASTAEPAVTVIPASSKQPWPPDNPTRGALVSTNNGR